MVDVLHTDLILFYHYSHLYLYSIQGVCLAEAKLSVSIVDALFLEYSEKIICLGDNGSVYCLNYQLGLLANVVDDEDVDISCLQVSRNGRCVQLCSSNGELYYYE